MHSRFGIGLKTLAATVVLLCCSLQTAAAQDADAEAGEQLILELRQVRSEVDFLRSQVETGGGVADVRFNDLQRRIDKVLQDAAALATQASTAQRQAETAVQRVDELERQMAVMQATIDQIATRLAGLEADAVFAQAQDDAPAVPADPADDAASSLTAEAEQTPPGADDAAVPVVVDADGVPVPLPKDRTIIAPPSRAVTADVAVADSSADVIIVPQTSVPSLVAVEGATRLEGELPVFPSARPEPPVRSIGAAAADETAEVGSTFADLTPASASNSTRSSNTTSGFDAGKQSFAAGAFDASIRVLQGLVDEGGMGARAPEGYYMLGTSYLREQQYASAIQILALGLRNYPTSDYAGASLVNLADALHANEQVTESCRLLSFVPIEYPNNAQAISDASARAAQFGC